MYFRRTPLLILSVLAMLPVRASDAEAIAISANIRAVHAPWWGIIDPIYASPTSNQIAGYTRCGDSALWTGAFLAAESFRYAVTHSTDALANVKFGVDSLNNLSAVTGDNRLARCMVPADSPYAAGIESEEAHNTIKMNPQGYWIWVDNTSRDQIVGAFFGLCIAYDLVPDDGIRSTISNLTTLLLRFVHDHSWSPNDDISNTFLLRPEELQMLVQVGRHINPSIDFGAPFYTLPVSSAVDVDVQSNDSYYKFNLDYMTFYNFVRLQNNDDNRSAYQTVRKYTASHQNAFFDIVDRAINGPNAARDAETRTLLEQVLLRSRRDNYVDVSNTVRTCFGEACLPVPVPLRPPTDFLWQRDPLQLTGGGSGLIEDAQIDYILPYWMGRYYGVIPDASVYSAAAPASVVAPGSLASLYGTNLTSGQQNVTVTVTDSAGTAFIAPLLYVSAGQINFEVPDGAAAGVANFTLSNGSTTQTDAQVIQAVAPALFTMNGTGSGVAAALAVGISRSNPQDQGSVAVFQCAPGCTSVPINVAGPRTVYLSLYGTGIRHVSSLANVTATIHGVSVPVLYAGAAPGFTGLDQVNLTLLPALAGSGESNVILTVDGVVANTVTIDIQ